MAHDDDIIRKNPFTFSLVGDCTKFLTLDRSGNPVVSFCVENYMRGAARKYRKTHKEPLPPVRPHIMRHTFCTNMANAGMGLKSLQYIMGHYEIGVTLSVYTRATFACAENPLTEGQRKEVSGMFRHCQNNIHGECVAGNISYGQLHAMEKEHSAQYDMTYVSVPERWMIRRCPKLYYGIYTLLLRIKKAIRK